MIKGTISKVCRHDLTVLIAAAMLFTSLVPATVQNTDAASKPPVDLQSITWKITGAHPLGNLSYHVRKIIAVNGISVDSSEDMRTSYAYCVEPMISGPDSGCGVGDTYTAGLSSAGGHGERIYTFDGSDAAD